MFRKNTKHSQTNIFGFTNIVSSKMAKELQDSEEQKFYELIFCNIKEEDFACLYSETDSRPNVPVNCMVSALILQNRHRLTYEKLFDSIKFNLLTKIALGLQTLDEVPFSEASLFNFQNKLNSYFIETGINLLERAFDHLTEKQLKQLKIKTDIQRTDSFQAASNIRRYSRLQLLVEMLIRIYRVLSEKDQKQYEELFSPYVKKTSGQFIYRLDTEDIPSELQRVGKVYKEINDRLKPKNKEVDIFKTFERVYLEHFTEVEEKIIIKTPEELTSSCLQSPDDIDATYRKKNNKQFYGQTINITETCNPDNPIDLLTDISVHANNIDDSKDLNERIDSIKGKNPELNELHFDGAYGSEDNDLKFDEHKVTPVQTAIRGRKDNGVEITVTQINESVTGREYLVSCPNQSVEAEVGKKRFKAEFDLNICSLCSFASECKLIKKKSAKVYYFTVEEYLKKKRLASIQKIPKDRRSLRTNVEATVSEFTRKMSAGSFGNNRKLKVRGYFKATIFAFAVGISVNFGRIYRHQKALAVELGQLTT
ncbi:MAG: transposase [Candidatus Cloacimonetes bacterium]|nr:transposase [Candidatus Cloacimonadota bacterium]